MTGRGSARVHQRLGCAFNLAVEIDWSRFGLVIALALFTMCLAISGCTSCKEYFSNGFKVGPNYSPPIAPDSEQWIDISDERVLPSAPKLKEWWSVFDDVSNVDVFPLEVNHRQHFI